MKTTKCLLVLLIVVAARSASARCFWETAPSAINFGTYLPITGGAPTGTSSYLLRCTPNTTATVTLTRGSNSAVYINRTMRSAGGDLLPYNLYVDPTYTSVWGDGTGGSTSVPYNTGPGGGVSFFNATIYGRVFAGADVAPGVYTDLIDAVINEGGSTDSRQFTVSAVVQSECTVAAFTLDFGNYDPLAAHAATPLDSSAPIDVRCTKNTLATAALSWGNNPAGGLRRMISAGGVFLDYQVYLDPSRLSVWDTTNTKSGTSVSKDVAVVLNPNGAVVYGRVFANQDVSADTYTDTLQAIVNY